MTIIYLLACLPLGVWLVVTFKWWMKQEQTNMFWMATGTTISGISFLLIKLFIYGLTGLMKGGI